MRSFSDCDEGNVNLSELSNSGRIIVADDHPIFRSGLCMIVKRSFPQCETLEAATWSEVLTAARQGSAPEMFILDLMFPGLDIDRSIAELRSEFPHSYIVAVSMLNDRSIVDRVTRAGADGYIGKDIPPEMVGDALQEVRNGGFVIKCSGSNLTAPAAKSQPQLTTRQAEVLELLITGKSNKEIARLLGISPFTVRIHVSSLFKQLGVTTRSGAAVKGLDALELRKG